MPQLCKVLPAGEGWSLPRTSAEGEGDSGGQRLAGELRRGPAEGDLCTTVIPAKAGIQRGGGLARMVSFTTPDVASSGRLRKGLRRRESSGEGQREPMDSPRLFAHAWTWSSRRTEAQGSGRRYVRLLSPNPPMRSGLGVGTRGEGRGTRRSALDSDKWGRWRPLVVVGGADGGPGQRRWGGVGGTACRGRQSRTGPVRLCGSVG